MSIGSATPLYEGLYPHYKMKILVNLGLISTIDFAVEVEIVDPLLALTKTGRNSQFPDIADNQSPRRGVDLLANACFQ